MKAIVYNHFKDKLQKITTTTPVPEDHEVLIKIHYAGVNPVDWKIRDGLFESKIKHVFPITPGWDASGVIVSKGKEVKNLSIGDEVYALCIKPVFHDGTYAEYITFDAENVALKPTISTFAEAAAYPLVTLTAWQALFNVGKLTKGETILIQAGSGGVGSVAIPLAKWAGAEVITTTGPNNLDYVKSLGADLVIDYTQDSFGDIIREKYPEGIDFVFDMFGGKILRDSLPLIKKGGREVSIYENLKQSEAAPFGITSHYVFVRPNGKELDQIRELIETGILPPPSIKEFSLEDAEPAQDLSRDGHTRGKIVLKT